MTSTATREFVGVFEADKLKDGEMTGVDIRGREILIARVGGKFYAADKRCPHLGGDLSRGKLDGMVVTCPRHGSRFDLSDGHVVRWTDWSGIKLTLAKIVKAPRPLATYPTKVENNRLFVAI